MEKTSELFLRAKVALERWHSNVLPEAELSKTFGELLDKFAAPADPLMEYRATKLKEGAESALLMVLAHGVKESTLEKIAASFPKDSEGQEAKGSNSKKCKRSRKGQFSSKSPMVSQ